MLALYLVPFSGETLEATVTDDAAIFEYWLKINVVDGKSCRIIGLACKHKSLRSIISTIHLCVGTKCLVLQLRRIDSSDAISPTLKLFLGDPRNVFVGVHAGEIVSALKGEFGAALECEERVFDVRALAERRFPFSCGGGRSVVVGIKTLARRLVNLRPWKPSGGFAASEGFECAKVDKEHVKSVCVDVYVLRRIGVELFVKRV